MLELDVKKCIVSNISIGQPVVVNFGMRESHPELFSCKESQYLLVEMDIGIKGSDAANLFSVQVLSVEALRYHHIHLKKNPNNKYIVLFECSWEIIEARLEEIIHSCQGYTFDDCCEKLRHSFNWEYENMK